MVIKDCKTDLMHAAFHRMTSNTVMSTSKTIFGNTNHICMCTCISECTQIMSIMRFSKFYAYKALKLLSICTCTVYISAQHI